MLTVIHVGLGEDPHESENDLLLLLVEREGRDRIPVEESFTACTETPRATGGEILGVERASVAVSSIVRAL